MCGIAGYIGKGNAQAFVVNALKQLEYRGYDSWGLASIKIDHIDIFKQKGQIGQVSTEQLDPNPNIAIGHTRWATHGEVTDENAHPFRSYDDKIAVVHNGIIENAKEIRKFLAMRGVQCKTPVDSEVIPHIVSVFMNQGLDFEDSIVQAMQMLEGYYAIAVIHQDFDKLAIARNGVPLVVGLGKDEYYIASDPTAFLDKTRNALFLNDGEYCIINHEIKLKEIKTKEDRPLKTEEVKWKLEDVDKGNFDHFMLKEINEQPRVISKAVAFNKENIKAAAKKLQKANQVLIIACGSSFFAATLFEHQLLKKKIDARAVPATELDQFLPFLDENSFVIAISQSGETADTIDAVKKAKEKNAQIGAIVNVEGSALARLADITMFMQSGPEICVVATKSFLCTIAIFFAINGELESNPFYPVSLSDRVNRIIQENNEDAKELAEELKDSEHIYLIGQGIGKSVALESNMKIKEISYIHAEAFSAGELKHGPNALIEKDTPIIAFSTKDDFKSIDLAASEMSSRGGKIISISEIPLASASKHIQIINKDNTGCFEQFVFCQLLAYHLALLRKCDPDKPRNLAKSVTVK